MFISKDCEFLKLTQLFIHCKMAQQQRDTIQFLQKNKEIIEAYQSKEQNSKKKWGAVKKLFNMFITEFPAYADTNSRENYDTFYRAYSRFINGKPQTMKALQNEIFNEFRKQELPADCITLRDEYNLLCKKFEEQNVRKIGYSTFTVWLRTHPL